jgi:dipeptidase D
MVLAILADKTLKHGPLEGLFTTDEETTMEGASKIRPGFIHSPYLINVDSEESWRICIGCAGGFEAEMFIPLAKTEAEGWSIRVELKGGVGGHSGIEIDKGHANVVKALGQVINESLHHAAIPEVFLQYYVGGDKRNVIPPAARCAVVVPGDKKDAFLAELHKQEAILKDEWKSIEPGLEFIETIKPDMKKHVTFDAACSRRFLDAVLIVPHGVIRMSPDVPGLVETSVNVYRAFLCDMCAMTEAPIGFFARSSDNGYMPIFHRQLAALARAIGARITEPQAFFPGWLPDTTNPLLTVAKQCYQQLNGKPAEIYAIHAGLECGMFQTANPHLKCISVGPFMLGVHSPMERLYISTVMPIYQLIVRILEVLDK